MYNNRPNLMLGFHGCDESIRDHLVNNPNSIKKSEETYDWLGNGFYVWENNYDRALQWAKDKKKRGTLTTPSVLGVIYQLDHCLDFTDSAYIKLITQYYSIMKDDFSELGRELPKNKDLPKDQHHDLILRELDCSVIQYLHQKISETIVSETKAKGYS